MRSTAEQELRAWVRSPYFVQLEDEEVDKLLEELVDRQYSSPPKTVANIVRRLFPHHFSGEKNMSTNRVVPPRKPQAAPPQQSIEDVVQVVKKYEQTGHWQSCASQFESPARSKANFVLLANAIKDFRETGKHIRVADICDIVLRLASAGVFERVPTVQVVETPKPVEVAPEPDARELHNRQVKIERAMNDRDTSPIKGAKERPQQLIKPIDNSNVAEAAASEKAARENAIVQEALSRINTFTGHSHSRTASGRAAMREEFQAAMNEGKPAEEVLAAVEAEASRLSGNSSIR